jgi:hypothetical protein
VPSKGDLLWSGRVAWTHDENSMESIDIPPLPVGKEERCLLSVRNTSPTVDVTVYVGHMVKAHPDGESASKVWSLGSSGSNTIFQSTAHGLLVGDALECLTAGGSNCTAGVIYYVHGADHATAVPADTLYLSLTRTEGGALIDATTAVAGTFEIAEEFYVLTSFTLGKWAVGVVATPVAEAGLISKVVDTWPFASGGGRLMIGYADTGIGDFNVYAEIRRA